ncbi:malonyl CoA-acyl carrier protein transacylase [Propionigenium maris DSM 9537]|uniref:Malonyl CoA-acyl carrier protein transacylase n=1 Tax=Propionigenium maris DSM 9537 TaxID=1123000 RepID=A0A9W6GL88_9FUSO|nr:ACP S-malonyltransferase [Propionigenium maris]GLI56010.1 malonyl CoA-acyl carrier protein transacylase [Propionigenium maris DSM 9537]
MSKVAFVFPGQGSQYVGMGKELYENNETARKYFDEIFDSLSIDLKEVMFEGPEEKLKETKYTQPAIVAMSLVLTKLLEEKGVKADYVAGHSVGEYAAIGAAGYLSLGEAVKLTSTRGEIMNEISAEVNGTMAAIIGMEADKIDEVLKGIDGVAEAVNFNEPKQTVIAGEVAAIENACEALKEAGARRAMILAVSGPFHSSLMKPAGEKILEAANTYEFKNTEVKLVANTTAKVVESAEELKDELYNQAFGPVKWVDTVTALKEAGVEKIYEIGPGKVLKGLIRKIDKTLEVENVEKLEDLA